jgi:hypothetical protein
MRDGKTMMLSEREAFKRFKSQICVTPQQVILAKAFMLENFDPVTSVMINKLLKSLEMAVPEEIILHESADTEDMIKRAAEAVSWTLAGSEGIWGLIYTNLLIPTDHQLNTLVRFPGWTTIHGRSGGSAGGWQQDIYFPVPIRVTRPYSIQSSEEPARHSLSDPDLFLHGLDIQGLHQGVEKSLREAVRCFRHELYLACLTMLGRASEGAWIELGIKLAETVESERGEKLKSQLESPHTGIAKKISEVIKFYNDRTLFDQIYLESRIKGQDLANSTVWADAVRDSRNSIHYGVEPAMENGYEKIAALLIGSVPHLRVVYRVIAAIDRVHGRTPV